jgi:DnaJ-class molecular chaperone
MDHYSTLGVPRNASQEDIKKAYRSLAMKYHPDRGGDTNKFKEIEEAYRVLSDAGSRANYDQPKQHSQHMAGGFDVPPGFEGFFNQFGGTNFSDLFRPQRPRNRDLNFHTRISLEDAFHGRELVLNFYKANGQEKILNVKVPAGIQNGMTLRLSGVGDDSMPHVPTGDVLVTIEIYPHPEFTRQGDDLVKDITIDCIDAMLGKEIEISTLDNKKLTGNIPPGTQPDSILNIPGHGMPNINNPESKGRLLLHIKMVVPNLNTSQKDYLSKLYNV